MMSDATCNARLAELELYERKGIRGGIVLGNEKSRYEEFLKCRECKGGDAMPQKLRKRAYYGGGRKKNPVEPCIMDGCKKMATVKRMCKYHYDQQRIKKR